MEVDGIHQQVLKKFNALKGETLTGRGPIKGKKTGELVPPDKYVNHEHIMHDLIRGFYKPAKKPYLLSYQATESVDNYGEQIRWINKKEYSYEIIEMHPPDSSKDNRKKSDISAARFNMTHKIPLGIFLKKEKGINTILGLGIISMEREDGVFIVRPFEQIMQEEISSIINKSGEADRLFTDVLREVKQRYGQDQFRAKLMGKFRTCAICDISNEYSIASHIKPWAESTHEERLDENNGLILCPNHDYLFDNGLITFDTEGIIMISDKLRCDQTKEFNINRNLKINLSETSERYMEYHRREMFKN